MTWYHFTITPSHPEITAPMSGLIKSKDEAAARRAIITRYGEKDVTIKPWSWKRS